MQAFVAFVLPTFDTRAQRCSLTRRFFAPPSDNGEGLFAPGNLERFVHSLCSAAAETHL
jgi:hypothetical protein